MKLAPVCHRFTIPNWHPASVNRLLNRHHFKRAKIKRGDADLVAVYSLHVPRAAGPRSVQLFITLGPGQRACDPDNYNKSAMDALVKCRLLRDDSRQWCTILPAQFTPREPAPATTIELRELEEQGT